MSWLVLLSLPAFAWPADSDWLPLQRGGFPLDDPADDTSIGGDSLDLVGDDLEPVAFWYADADALFLRLRVAGDPATMTGAFLAQDWGFLIEADGDDAFEHAVISESAGADLRAYPNADGTPGTQPGFEHYGQPWLLGDLESGHVRRQVGAANTFFVDLRVTHEALDDLGLLPDAPLRLTAVTGPSIYLDWADLAGCHEPVADCPDLDDAQSEPIYVDQDRDGLTDPVEAAIGTDPLDADSDDDGLLDGAEPMGDVDGDGHPNALDCDSDGDGVRDSVEAGLTAGDVGGDTDTGAGCFRADADPTSTTDPYDADSDGGGLDDGIEDWNGDGDIDPWETDPNDPTDDVDSDGDQIADVLEEMGADAEVVDVDSDGDGHPDADEWLYDTDGDGVPNFLDDDSDGDGLLDADETLGDRDGDGIPNFEDTDSDDDGIPDAVEGLVDSDGDGTADALDYDSDDDGVLDQFEGDDDFDGDGTPDYLDDDSDGDGLSDEVEGNRDPDDDGQPNFNDLDSDDDGIPDEIEGDDDPDFDGVPNFEDRNSDGQGPTDGNEGFGDGDCDGIEDWLDPDEEDSFCDDPQPNPGIDPEIPPAGPDDPVLFADGDFTGGSCASTGGLGLFGAPILFAMAVMRRRRGAAAGALLATTPALAQDINAQRFAPSIDSQSFVSLEDLELGEAWTPTASLWVNHADDPFVFRPDGADEIEVLGAVTSADLTAAYNLGPARLGVGVPVHMVARGFGIDHPTHLGDIRLSAKARGLERTLAGDSVLRIGASVDAVLPTGNPDAWVGAGQAWVRGSAVGELRVGRWRVASNLGMRSGTGQEFGDLTVRPAFLWGAGGAYALTEDLVAAVELGGDVWFGNGGQPGAVPLEWLASGRYTVPDGPWSVIAGAGTGLTRGVGSPDFRVTGGVRWAPPRRELVDVLADAPSTSDDDSRAEPGPAHLTVRVDNPFGVAVAGASVDLGDGVPHRTGSDGTLTLDVLAGGYALTVDAAGYSPESRDLTLVADGMADVSVLLRPDRVVVDLPAKRVFLHRKVFFELDRAELKIESLAVLDDLIEALLEHPEIARLRVEGHTDIQGTHAHNETLSDARAASVVTYLTQNGIDAKRLVAKGFGETRVLQEGDSEDVHATNRRVEFHIESVDEGQRAGR